MKSVDIVFGIHQMACLWHVRQCMTCLLDLAVEAVGCRLRTWLHKCVVTLCFLFGSQRVGKKSTNCVRLMSRSVCGQCLCTTSTQISWKGHSCYVASLTASPDIFLHLFLKIFPLTVGTLKIIHLGSLYWLYFFNSSSEWLGLSCVASYSSQNLFRCIKMCVWVFSNVWVCPCKTEFSICYWSVLLCVWGREGCAQEQLDFGFYHVRHW